MAALNNNTGGEDMLTMSSCYWHMHCAAVSNTANSCSVPPAKPVIEPVQALADILRLCYVVIATKPVH